MTAAAERRVLLDTSVVIAPPADGFAAIADWVAVSVITVAELQYGIGAAPDPLERQHRRNRIRYVSETFSVIALDEEIADSYGVLANLVRVAGRNPRPRRLDLLIAATAERHGLSLATRNPKDFEHLESVLHVVEVG